MCIHEGLIAYHLKIKVLPLQKWMKLGGWGEPCDVSPIDRDGWYLSNGLCWYEYKGKTYTNKHLKRDFKFQLKLFNTVPYRKEEEDAIETLVKAGLASKAQIEHYRCIWQIELGRDIKRSWNLNGKKKF